MPEKLHAFAITNAMSAQIESPDDPISLQFIPSKKELRWLPEEKKDPIEDFGNSPLRILVHRHKNRVLLKPTLKCAVYCRFCFRREMVGPGSGKISNSELDDALSYISSRTEIHEVILTGGDPFVLPVSKLSGLMRGLHSIPHLKWLRLHTRIPIVSPEMISQRMLAALIGPKPVFIAVHSNHAREFTPAAGIALDRLSRSGIPLFGQSVILKNINNDVNSLRELFETMMSNRIKPYYLHHPDLTVGTSHFRISLMEGMGLMEKLRGEELSGLCIPHYVLDLPNGKGKVPVTSDFVKVLEAGSYLVKGPDGSWYPYHDLLEK